MHKLCFIDVETTGLNAKKNGIIQIAGQVIFGHKAKYDVIETFNFTVQPFPFDVVNQKALEVNGVTEVQIQKFRIPREVFIDFISMLNRHVEKNNPKDKMFFVAYNTLFDYSFMQEWFIKNGATDFNKYFDYRYIDVLQHAILCILPFNDTIQNFKLITVANYFNITTNEPLHDALTDILMTKGIFFHCVNQLAKNHD